MVARLGRRVGGVENMLSATYINGGRLSVSGLRVIIRRTRGTGQDVGPSVKSMYGLDYLQSTLEVL